jgi:TolA-binding protein
MLSAECYVRTGKRARALAHYERVINQYARSPSAENALFEQGKILYELGKRRKALAAFQRYLSTYPRGQLADAASFRRCELLVALGDRGDGRSCLEEYVRDFPGGAKVNDARLLLATTARLEARWAQAAELYGAYRRESTHPARREEALYQRAFCMRQGNIEGWAALVRQYLAEYPHGRHADELRNWR